MYFIMGHPGVTEVSIAHAWSFYVDFGSDEDSRDPFFTKTFVDTLTKEKHID